MKPYIMLAFAIISEVTGATMLKLSGGFTHPVFTILAIAGYVVSLVILGFTLKYLPLGIAYAIWGGVGTILTALVGVIAWHDNFGWISALGLALVVGGIVFLETGERSEVESPE